MPSRRFAERFLHVDMDAFYVEVERMRDSSLRGKPVVVGGLGPRGVVASASYEARSRGVRSAMPIGEARRRCPGARFLPPDHGAYRLVSKEVFAVLESFSPSVEALSVDEAFIDISGLRLHYSGPDQVAAAIRSTLAARPGLPASVGGATSKFLAKLASQAAKPDGVLIIEAGSELAFLHPLPVRRVWGVGQATYAALDAMGIATIGDLAAADEKLLARRLGPALGAHLARLAAGRDDRLVEPATRAKSVSVEETYPADLADREEIANAVLRLCDRLSARLRRNGLAGRTVTLKVRLGDFTTFTRSATSADPVSYTAGIWRAAGPMLEQIEGLDNGVRLLGVGVAALADPLASRQLSMAEGDRDAAHAAVESVRARFGDDAVRPASLTRPSPKGGHPPQESPDS